MSLITYTKRIHACYLSCALSKGTSMREATDSPPWTSNANFKYLNSDCDYSKDANINLFIRNVPLPQQLNSVLQGVNPAIYIHGKTRRRSQRNCQPLGVFHWNQVSISRRRWHSLTGGFSHETQKNYLNRIRISQPSRRS